MPNLLSNADFTISRVWWFIRSIDGITDREKNILKEVVGFYVRYYT